MKAVSEVGLRLSCFTHNGSLVAYSSSCCVDCCNVVYIHSHEVHNIHCDCTDFFFFWLGLSPLSINQDLKLMGSAKSKTELARIKLGYSP